MQMNRGLIPAIGLAVAVLVAAGGAAHAQVTTADVGVNKTFEQTGPSTVTSSGGFFSARAFFPNAGDYLDGTVTFSGPGSPVTLVPQSLPTGLVFADGSGDFSALQTKYPDVDYNFDLSGGSQPETTFTIPYEGGGYSLDTPQLTAASFDALQGANAGDGLTLSWNSFEFGEGATDNDLFFSITDTSTGMVVFSPDLAVDATGVFVPAGTLAAGHSYTFDLNFSGRIVPESTVVATEFYDTHTDGAFSAAGAVPEPSTWAMMLVGFGGLGLAVARRGKKQVVTASAH
jgi:hypothetical protein